MTEEQKKVLVESYPTLFQDYRKKSADLPVATPFSAYGFEVGRGWFDLVKKLCEDLMKLDPWAHFRVTQIKEKFGGLRVYFSGWPDDQDKCGKMWTLIAEAEKQSCGICERCGTTEGVELKGSWIKALCPTCRVARDKE